MDHRPLQRPLREDPLGVVAGREPLVGLLLEVGYEPDDPKLGCGLVRLDRRVALTSVSG